MDAIWFAIGFVSAMIFATFTLLQLCRQIVRRLKDQHDDDIDKACEDSYNDGIEWARCDPATVRGNYNAMFGIPSQTKRVYRSPRL